VDFTAHNREPVRIGAGRVVLALRVAETDVKNKVVKMRLIENLPAVPAPEVN
jgi:hypothetical protein